VLGEGRFSQQDAVLMSSQQVQPNVVGILYHEIGKAPARVLT
jgi:hypothetical protein